MRIEIVTTNDKHQPYYHFHGYLWKPEGEVKAIIHVVHGMTEHMGRYDAFAEEMNKHGIAVAGYDLRGHGRNDNQHPAATFISGAKDKDFGWETAVEDIRLQIYQVANMLPNVKYYLMGFSLGSFLVRDLMRTLPPLVENVFLVGTGFQPSMVLSLMSILTKAEAKRTPAGTMSDLTRRLAFDTYNQQLQKTVTPMDWLCSDADELRKYRLDPLVNKEIAADLFHEMIDAMKRTCVRGAYKKVPNKPNIMLISGMEDPVGGAEGVAKCKQYLEKEGFCVQSTCVRGARHDVFHEFETGAAYTFQQTIIDYIIASINK